MLLGWLVRLLIAVLLIRVVWNFVSGRLEGASRPARHRPTKHMALVRDPVCGTYLQPSRALTTRAGTKVHYFCSEDCRQAFGSGVGRSTNEVSS
jgi:YHS domain-containing protein